MLRYTTPIDLLVNTPKIEAPIRIVKLEKGMDKPVSHKLGLKTFHGSLKFYKAPLS